MSFDGTLAKIGRVQMIQTATDQPEDSRYVAATGVEISGLGYTASFEVQYGPPTVNGSDYNAAVVDGDGAAMVFQKPSGFLDTPPWIATNASTETLLASASSIRRILILQNTDATNSVHIGESGAVGPSQGLVLGPGESITLELTSAMYGFASAATPAVAVAEFFF